MLGCIIFVVEFWLCYSLCTFLSCCIPEQRKQPYSSTSLFSVFLVAEANQIHSFCSIIDSCSDSLGYSLLHAPVVPSYDPFGLVVVSDHAGALDSLTRNECFQHQLLFRPMRNFMLFCHSKEIFSIAQAFRTFSLVDTTAGISRIVPMSVKFQRYENGYYRGYLEMDGKTMDDFRKFTSRHISRYIAISLDDTVYCVPRIEAVFSGGYLPLDGLTKSEVDRIYAASRTWKHFR